MKNFAALLICYLLTQSIDAQGITGTSTAVTKTTIVNLGLKEVRFYHSLIPSGLDVQLDLTINKTELSHIYLATIIGGGFQDKINMRNDAGDPFRATTRYDSLNAQWQTGINWELGEKETNGLLTFFGAYRGAWFDYHNDNPSLVFNDSLGLLNNSIFGGISWDSIVTDLKGVQSGYFGEISFDFAPSMINDKSDYIRGTLQGMGFLPLTAIPELYFGSLFVIDYTYGNNVPIFINQSIGGWTGYGAVGERIRGYISDTYDTSLKIVLNSELRYMGPTFLEGGLKTVFYVFGDVGYYNGFTVSQQNGNTQGQLASTGLGFAIDAFGLAQLGLYGGYTFVPDLLYDATSLFYRIGLTYHF